METTRHHKYQQDHTITLFLTITSQRSIIPWSQAGGAAEHDSGQSKRTQFGRDVQVKAYEEAEYSFSSLEISFLNHIHLFYVS